MRQRYQETDITTVLLYDDADDPRNADGTAPKKYITKTTKMNSGDFRYPQKAKIIVKAVRSEAQILCII